jgi:predicted  nucleic acid-binding Zn-ribbon protein
VRVLVENRKCNGLAATFLGYTMAGIFLEAMMARKDRLTRVAVGIGTAMGKADRKAQQVAKAGVMAKEELEEIAKQVESLKRQLQKTTKRLKAALR